jgi:DNA-binding SARP family transcriptional activator
VYLLRTLGAVALHPEADGGPLAEPLLAGSKTLVLAAYLAERPDGSATREHLSELFWPGVPAPRARRSLRQALYYLSHSGGEGILVSERESVRFIPERCQVDQQRFERALREERFEDAVELYSGAYLLGFDAGRSRELATWIESVRQRLDVGYRQALTESARTALIGGDVESAVKYARRGAEVFPLSDPIHALLIEALIAADRPQEAVREYEAYRVLLREELEDVPSDDLREIGERARQQVRRQAGFEIPPKPEVPGPETSAGPAGRTEPEGAVVPDRRSAAAEPVAPGGARTWFEALLLVTMIAAAVLLVLMWLGGKRTRAPSVMDTPSPAATQDSVVRLRVSQRMPGHMRSVTVELAARGATEARIVPGSESPPDHLSIQSPDGRYEAVRVPTPNGPDLEIVDARTGERVAAVPNRDGRTPDDHIQGWSPDGRVLLFDSGLYDEAGEYDQRLFLFDVESREMRPLTDLRIAQSRNAAWSPLGDRIAFEGYRAGAGLEDPRTDIFVVSIDGREVVRMTDDDARESEIDWSPDGTRLVYQKGDLKSSDIYLADPATATETPLVVSGWSDRSPIWISHSEIAFVREQEGVGDLWVVGTDGATTARRLTWGLDLADIWQRLGWGGSVPWIESVDVRVDPPGGTLSPGEHARLQVEIRDAAGAPVIPEASGLEWRVFPLERASVRADRLLVVEDTGAIRLEGGVRGWRADTLVLKSRRLAADPEAELLFEETWDRGLATDSWEIFGEPKPVVDPRGAPEGAGLLLNRGDQNFESGALTKRRFPVEHGISVEVWGRAPFTPALYQTWSLELTSNSRLDPATAERHPAGRSARVRMMSSAENGAGTATLSDPVTEMSVPVPRDIDTWRRHTLQLHPDGAIEWIVDGRRHASLRSAAPVPDSLHVAIGGRMVGTRIEHGALRVWRGLRYVPE